MAGKKKKAAEPSAGKTGPLGGDEETIERRQRRVIRFMRDGYTLREIADALLQLHMDGDTVLFTFMAHDGRTKLTPDQVRKIPREDLRTRAYAVVKWDAAQARAASEAELSDVEQFGMSRYMLNERYRTHYREVREKMAIERDSARWNNFMRTANDLAARIGRLQGIETEKPMEHRIGEEYVAWIDDDGIVHRDKVKPGDDKPN